MDLIAHMASKNLFATDKTFYKVRLFIHLYQRHTKSRA